MINIKTLFYTKKDYDNLDIIWDSRMRSCNGNCNTEDHNDNLECKCQIEYDNTHIKPIYNGKTIEIPSGLHKYLPDNFHRDIKLKYQYCIIYEE